HAVPGVGKSRSDRLRAREHLLRTAVKREDVDGVRGDRCRPGDAVLVVVLFDDRSHDAPRSDPVAAAEEWLFLPVLVEERRPKRLRVEAAEVEDVPDLDCRAEDQRTAALRATVAVAWLSQVGEARLEVSSRLDTAQVPAVAVRAGHVLPLAQRLVCDHLAGEGDRGKRTPARAARY